MGRLPSKQVVLYGVGPAWCPSLSTGSFPDGYLGAPNSSGCFDMANHSGEVSHGLLVVCLHKSRRCLLFSSWEFHIVRVGSLRWLCHEKRTLYDRHSVDGEPEPLYADFCRSVTVQFPWLHDNRVLNAEPMTASGSGAAGILSVSLDRCVSGSG